MKQEAFDYAGYLVGKKAIDDLSLNPEVWQVFSDCLSERQRKTRPTRALKVLEVGAGIGTMITRLLETGLLKNCVYTAVELQTQFRDIARIELCSWCQANDYTFESRSDSTWHLHKAHTDIEIQWLCADLLQIEHLFPPQSFDLLLGHAVIDLLPVPDFLPLLLARLVPGGGFYFTINYAGKTVLLPPHPMDDSVMQAYHQDMDKRFPGLDWQPSQTGLLLGPWLRAQDYQVLAEGNSDWLIASTSTSNDAHKNFVANIIDTMESALPTLQDLPDWLDYRRQQLQAGELHFRVANRDVFGLYGNEK